MILVKPDIKYYEQYKEMMDEWNMEGSRIAFKISYYRLLQSNA